MEDPLPGRVVLEHLQAVLDTLLRLDEAGNRRKSLNHPRNFQARYLQGFLPEKDEEEVDEVRRDDVEEDDWKYVERVAGFDASIGIPEANRERIVVDVFFAHFEGIAPRDWIVLKRKQGN